MTSDRDTAYVTADPEVVAAFKKFQAETTEVYAKRQALSEEMGRDLMVQRNGFGHGSSVVGFARIDSDGDGDLLGVDGALIVSNQRGVNKGMIVPYTKRKAGKEFTARLRECDSPGLKLPGMPNFHVWGANAGLVSGSPALWPFIRHTYVFCTSQPLCDEASHYEDVVYALWGTDTAPVKEPWIEIPLSLYYAASEAHDAMLDAKRMQVSGNGDEA